MTRAAEDKQLQPLVQQIWKVTTTTRSTSSPSLTRFNIAHGANFAPGVLRRPMSACCGRLTHGPWITPEPQTKHGPGDAYVNFSGHGGYVIYVDTAKFCNMQFQWRT